MTNYTANLLIEQIEDNKNQKEVTANAAFVLLDGAIAETLAVDITGQSSPLTLTASAARACARLRATGSNATVPFVLVVPAGKHVWIVDNAASVAVTVKTAGGTGPTLAAGKVSLVYGDGTNVVTMIAGGAGDLLAANNLSDLANAATARSNLGVAAPVYDVSVFLPGQPADGALLARVLAARAFTLPAGASGSAAYAGTAATGSATVTIQKNGAGVGTIDWSAAGQTGAFTVGSPVSFSAGDKLELVAPSPQDGTLADLSITLAGTR